jgi:hypothetical protein
LIPISKKKVPKKKKRDCDERHRLKKLINLLGWWNIAPHCFKSRNEAWICQKCKKYKINFNVEPLNYIDRFSKCRFSQGDYEDFFFNHKKIIVQIIFLMESIRFDIESRINIFCIVIVQQLHPSQNFNTWPKPPPPQPTFFSPFITP